MHKHGKPFKKLGLQRYTATTPALVLQDGDSN